MKFNYIAIRIIEEAIEKEEMIGIAEDGKLVKHNDNRAQMFVKTYKNDKVSDVVQRMSNHNRPQYNKSKKPFVKNTYYNRNYYNANSSEDSGACATGAKLMRISNRYQ